MTCVLKILQGFISPFMCSKRLTIIIEFYVLHHTFNINVDDKHNIIEFQCYLWICV